MYTGKSQYRFDEMDLRDPIEPSLPELRFSVEDTITEPSSFHSLQTTSPLCIAPSSLQKQTSTNTWHLNSSATHAEAQKLTVLGAVRFLDHFSDLYGNVLSARAQRKSDAVLKAVLKVFSFQWLSNRGSSCDDTETFDEHIWTESPNVKEPKGSAEARDFVDAWFQARSLINDSKSVRSFRIVYAILLFDTIPIPEELIDAVGYSGWKHEFLDLGLRKLSTLDALVRRYCANLGPFSGYGDFMESSLNIVLWFGYLRDTVASLMTSRQCRLPEIPMQSKPAPARPQFLDLDSENNVPDICRRALAGAFHLWRQIIKIKNQTLSSTSGVKHGILESVLAINSTMTAIDAFHRSYHTLLAYCPAGPTPLSVGSTKFWVSLMIFWNLGLLVFAESSNSVLNECEYFHQHLISKIRALQQQAASSLTRTVECVFVLPTVGSWKPDSGLGVDVPITACHVTPSIAVTTLEKAIEQIIEVQSDSETGLIFDGVWNRHVAVLMKGLVSLEVTIGGSRIAGAALRSLMQRYGDIISECWSV
ncbi:hypothetical protein LTR99_001792 [Exophiala xenobiotica]|uniref:Transcription factor domain-containing protein n=1 Tax=Vermiconidia calcicola TaxID=1690605 RepID=A0AAV9Q5R9_9PEZI|nr:hypothetical protein LTR92_007430 [Exophiala xenobiotica]KAK5536560.1 hypothetical protein LTR25_005234 [Vermiconidia calcicola]KAK5543299.1 hypothetical protein LTR23_004776 [Chaetothyriales sp. CCFEE 6169]KAK5217781.1 hypothetical protein LTR72_009444 [Exophiala xenobiotica]KAK5272400.1 hypothetical protein LTR96_002030 [Exophiala xenobiotica]